MKKTQLLLLPLLLGVFGCKSELEKSVVGKWEAHQLTECDEVVPIQTALVNLELRSNGTYVFNSTLNVHEEGSYRIQKNFLFRTDKVQKNAPEKAVRIDFISADTLMIAMNFKGKDQILTLLREGTAERVAKKELAAEAEQLKKDSLAALAELKKTPESPAKSAETPPSVAEASVAVAVAETKKTESTADSEAAKEEKRKADREAYLKRAAKEKKAEEAKEEKRKADREAYLKRAAKEKKEEAERKKKKKK